MFRVVIPARYASTRLPGKPLAELGGRPMIEHVWRRARDSGAAEVLVATDDERIAEACAVFGAPVEMTSASHASGTDRLAEVAARRGWADDAVVVNVQGDEPLLPPALISQVAALLAADRGADLATLATPVTSLEEYLNTHVVKVVTNDEGRALYFSRAPIPWQRDGAAGDLASQTQWNGAQRHLGLYAYRVAALQKLAAAVPSALEQAEHLEQLRALSLGMRIAVGEALEVPAPGVDTAADLARVAALLGAGAAR